MKAARRVPDGPLRTDELLTGAPDIAPATVFENCRFEGCTLQEADLSNCRFVECRFDGVNLSVAGVAGTAWRDVAFKGCKLSGIDWTAAARFGGVTFEECVLDQCAFLGMKLRRVVMRGCRLRGVVLGEADLTDADLRGSDLTGAQFARTKLVRADLRGATGYVIHPGENFVRGVKVSLPDALTLLAALGVDLEL